MKIGIITLPLHNNYGGILQAYALQKVLQNLGHDATIIDRSQLINLKFTTKLYRYCGRIIKKILFSRKGEIRKEGNYNRIIKTMRTNTFPFILKNIKRIEVKYDYSNIKENQFDAFIVGSDQVWRPIYFGPDIITNAYLSFAKDWNVKRISYAASFGTEEWEYTQEQTVECKRLLKNFKAVSVRENSAKDLCKKYFDVDATHVLDPTMLLDSTDYIRLFETTNTPKSNGSIMCYILDSNNEKEKAISYIENYLNLKSFSVNSKYEIKNAPIEERIQPPVENWLRGFYDAEFVITDSFHACVFSILFEKTFIVYGNKKRGMTRFQSLLNIFGLENRLITEYKEVEKVINTPINWSKVNTIKKEWQQRSLNFIKENL